MLYSYANTLMIRVEHWIEEISENNFHDVNNLLYNLIIHFRYSKFLKPYFWKRKPLQIILIIFNENEQHIVYHIKKQPNFSNKSNKATPS